MSNRILTCSPVQTLLSLAEELREVSLEVLNLGLNEIFKLLNGISLDVNLLRLSILVDDLGVVGRSSTVPSEKLLFWLAEYNNAVSCNAYILGIRWDIGKTTLGSDGDETGLELFGSDLRYSVGRVL